MLQIKVLLYRTTARNPPTTTLPHPPIPTTTPQPPPPHTHTHTTPTPAQPPTDPHPHTIHRPPQPRTPAPPPTTTTTTTTPPKKPKIMEKFVREKLRIFKICTHYIDGLVHDFVGSHVESLCVTRYWNESQVMCYWLLIKRLSCNLHIHDESFQQIYSIISYPFQSNMQISQYDSRYRPITLPGF